MGGDKSTGAMEKEGLGRVRWSLGGDMTVGGDRVLGGDS